jgi:hypothetical protein
MRQRDHLSPMLFILVMEPLYRMFKKAQELNLLNKISKGCHAFRASLYADDVVVFIKPIADLQVTLCILQTTNLDKTQTFPIQCTGINMNFLAQFNFTLSNFPYIYLDLPLHFKKIPKACLYELIQKIANMLPGWKINYLSYPSRELLVKTVLTVVPRYFLMISKKKIFPDNVQNA